MALPQPNQICIQYISDIHIHIAKEITTNYFQVIGKILILAGDICNPFFSAFKQFIRWCSNSFELVLYVAGNAECHQPMQTIHSTFCEIQHICKQFQNVHFLNNSIFEYGDYRFIGTTLWTHLDIPVSFINADPICIGNFSYTQYNEMHETARHFICNALITTNKKCIVITHHTPLPELISQKEKYSRLLQWNCSNQTELLSLKCAKKIIAWIHGNSTPHQQNKVVNGIHFVCNSVGMNVNIQPTHLKTFKLII